MAFAVASKGAPLAGLLKKLLLATSSASGGAPLAYALRPAIVTAARRFFNTEGALLRRDDYDLEESSDDADAVDISCRTRDFSVPLFFSADVLDPFGAPTSLGRLLALMEDDASAAAPRTTGFSAAALRRGWWVSKEDDDAVQLKVAMPGLGKEHVKVRAEHNIVVIKGEGDKESEDDDNKESSPSRYSHRIELPADAFKMDQVRAEMKNGLLRVTVPKVKEEERKDVFQVKVE